MSSVNLLTLARLISKDSNDEEYFLKRVHWEKSDGTPIDWLELEDKRELENTIEGGNNKRPRYIQYYDGTNIKFKVLLDTYPITNSVQYYVAQPPALSDSVKPFGNGVQHLNSNDFKPLIHLN